MATKTEQRIETNFSAGPAAVPTEVLDSFYRNLHNYQKTGYSICEASHRGSLYSGLQQETTELLKTVLAIPDGYEVLYMAGGATLQFSLIPINFSTSQSQTNGGAYVVSGAWGAKALYSAQQSHAAHQATVIEPQVVYNGKDDSYTSLPRLSSLNYRPNSSYLHITSNETINGTQFHDFGELPTDVPVVADMSSDICSKPIPVANFDCIYAGAQKNLGCAGVTVMILSPRLQQRLAERTAPLPPYLDYRLHLKNNSCYNTPPVLAIYMLNLVLQWQLAQGGLTALHQTNTKKADLLYSIIDNSNGLYVNTIAPQHRSLMNVVFTLPTEQLSSAFLEGAATRNLVGIKGHRSVGGVRVSIYNAITIRGVELLAEYMQYFKQQYT